MQELSFRQKKHNDNLYLRPTKFALDLASEHVPHVKNPSIDWCLTNRKTHANKFN